MKKTVIVYGSTTGTCEDLAGRIAAKLGVDNVINVTDFNDSVIADNDNLILGTSTWGAGEVQDDWYDGIKVINGADLSGKTVALFGCGDSESYADTFVGGLAEIYNAAKEAGADYVGLDEYIEKIKGGWTDIDVIITMPSIMGKIGALGRVLGPRGLMPNPKSGTVTMDVAKAVKEVKQGKIDFKVDKSGIVHTSIGKVSFSADQIRDNAKEFISTLNKLKPTAAKGTYIKSIYLSSTMSAGIKIDPKSVEEI